jgi:hypothetical protein
MSHTATIRSSNRCPNQMNKHKNPKNGHRQQLITNILQIQWLSAISTKCKTTIMGHPRIAEPDP